MDVDPRKIPPPRWGRIEVGVIIDYFTLPLIPSRQGRGKVGIILTIILLTL
jgi:hypothetical protein